MRYCLGLPWKKMWATWLAENDSYLLEGYALCIIFEAPCAAGWDTVVDFHDSPLTELLEC